MEKRLAEIQERAAQILKELEKEDLTEAQITALEEEQRNLETEANTIKRKMDLTGRLTNMEERKADTIRGPDGETAEERAAKIQESGKMTITSTEVRNAIMQRSTLINTDTLLKPTKNGTEIHDNLNPVSSIIDADLRHLLQSLTRRPCMKRSKPFILLSRIQQTVGRKVKKQNLTNGLQP